MRLPLSWLRDFVDLRVSAEDLAERLITAGFEVERIIRPGAPDAGGNHGNFVIGRVAHFEKHPNADRLRLCQVDTGGAEPRQIVCGASNFAIGDTVVVAIPGAMLPGADAPLKQAKLRGEVSDGMMLSERELGLSDEHDGIITLPQVGGYEVGSSLADYVALDEVVLDVSVESNRGDCLSVYGLAREVAVLYGLDLAPVPGARPASSGGSTSDLVVVGIDAPDHCSRFTAYGFSNVAIGPSPLRIRQRLAAAGVRPISNVVDVTNYVMHELGNPLHVYDADCIRGKVLTARLAIVGEQITTLDGKQRVLAADTLVIADGEGPCGIAGVMGGAASEITAATTNVVLESACFERGSIQRSSAALGLRTDGSNRWEKGVSPHLAPIAGARAAELMIAWSGGQLLGDPQDVVAQLPQRDTIHLRSTRPLEVLGVAVEAGETEQILTGLGFQPTKTVDGWVCKIPYWRWLDTTREIDLIEEIGRVHGLQHVPADLPRIAPAKGGLTSDQKLRRRVEDHLTGAGLREVVTISLGDPALRSLYRLPGDDVVSLRNPLSADLSELRPSLLPSLLEVVRHNRSVGRRDLQIFEVGRAYRVGGEDGLAIENQRLGIVLVGHLGGSSWQGEGVPCDFGAITAVLDALLARLGVQHARVRCEDAPMLHPGRAAQIHVDGHSIGVIGEIHPGLAIDLEIDGPVALAEVDLEAFGALLSADQLFEGLSTFPPVRQDIAVIVSDTVEASALIETARIAGGALLDSAEVFDVFTDPQRLGEGRVSIAIRFAFQADDRTLTESEASELRERIVAALASKHGAELRG